MDLTQLVNNHSSLYLRTGRSNNIIVDGKIMIHDVRAIHNHGKGDLELISYNKIGGESHTVYIKGVKTVICDLVYWSKKIDYDELEA